MQKVKYRCEKCGYSSLFNKKEKYLEYIRDILDILGVVFILLLILYGVSGNNFFISYINKLVGRDFTSFAISHDDELRDIAVNFTRRCEGDFPKCYVNELFYNLKNLRYIPSSKYKILYSPMYVLDTGGDCRNTAALFVALVESLGFDAEVICDLSSSHCISKIPLKRIYESDNYEKNIYVDLSYQRIITLNKSIDIWQYYKE